MGVGRLFLRRQKNLTFWKLLGSGSGQGFTPKPNWGVYAILCVWNDEQAAQTAIANTALFRWYGAWSNEQFSVFLTPISARGKWSGQSPFTISDVTLNGPIAVLTRATLRTRAIFGFWGLEPPISAAIAKNNDIVFKIGLGEKPFAQQMTFSIWPDLAPMQSFARDIGAHATAIKQVRSKNMFAEELYARFRITHSFGTWGGDNPLEGHTR